MKRFVSVLLVLLLVLPLPLPANAAGMYVFTDKDSGTEISVPLQWNLEYQDDGMTKVKFVPLSDAAPLMTYGSADLWSGLSASQKNGLSRTQINNDIFSKADIAEIVSCDSSDVKMVTVNGQEYYRAVTEHTTTSNGYKFTLPVTQWIHVENGWFYIFTFSGDDSHSLYSTFKTMVGSAVYGGGGGSQPSGGGSDASTYSDAVSAYNRGRYSEAQRLFESVSSYSDSSKYLRLIRIRNAGSNPGMGGAVYNSACGLTASEKSDIDAAARDFYFADTASVLLCNSDVACYYLLGRWNGGSKCYIEFYTNAKAGCSYYIGSKLSTNYQSTYSIENGELRVDILNTNKLTLSLTLTGPDCMEVYTHEKGNFYTLNRK